MNIIHALSRFIYDQSEHPKQNAEELREILWRDVGRLTVVRLAY
jgi:hypothetical protein